MSIRHIVVPTTVFVYDRMDTASSPYQSFDYGSVERFADEFAPETDDEPDNFELSSRLAMRILHEEKPLSDWECGSIRDYYKPRSWKSWRHARYHNIDAC